MTEKTQPTDAELQQLWQNSNPTNFEAISSACAVLAKWGAPAPVEQPVVYGPTEYDDPNYTEAGDGSSND